jgi:hypothetical protein
MKGHIRTSWKITVALLASAAFGFGQAGSMSVRSGSVAPNTTAVKTVSHAQQVGPGTVNYVEGQASVDGQQISASASGGTALKAGQMLDTGNNGYVEVLLTPGAFLRLGNNSQIRVLQAGLVNTTVELDRGTALVEADQLIKDSHLAFVVHGNTTEIEKKGLYEFDANQQAIRVLDGKAKVSEPAGVKTIGKNDQLLFASAKPLKPNDFDKNAIKAEPLFVWSEARSADESQANVSTANYVMANGGWYGPGWYWDPYWSFYAFLPADGFLYSPFGWGFYSPAYLYAYGPYIGYPGFAYRGLYGYRGFHGHVGHVGGVAGRIAGYHGVGTRLNAGAFRGTAGGFHSMSGGFHGGGRR